MRGAFLLEDVWYLNGPLDVCLIYLVEYRRVVCDVLR
jgi:hypothetical protein